MTEDTDDKEKKKEIKFREFSIKNPNISNRFPDDISFNEFKVESNIPTPKKKSIKFNEFSVEKRSNNLKSIKRDQNNQRLKHHPKGRYFRLKMKKNTNLKKTIPMKKGYLNSQVI